LRKKLIEMLGGKADAPSAAPQPPPYSYPTPAPYPDSDRAPVPPPLPASPSYGPAPAPPPAFIPSETPAFLPPAAGSGPAQGDDDGLTRIMMGADLAKLKIPSHLFTLEILDRNGQWQPWSTIGAGGLKVGRSERSARFPELNTMAARHLKLSFDGAKLMAEDMGSLNGVFLRLSQPVELRDGTRFRVGGRVIEFRTAEPLPPSEPLFSEDGEEFWSADLQPLAYLDFIRPGGGPGLRFPVTNPDRTVFGRESRPGRSVDVALPDDDWVSGQHAQIRREGDRFLLEDLRSRNGTFVRLDGPTAVASGDILLVGRVLLRIVSVSGR
jgi:pSer/pThr/pTyr-binding forkhead associated (FHA) protein